MEWDIVVEKAVRDDGTLFFPQKLTQAFLDNVRREMGSYIYANQYQNDIVPEDEKKFKSEWIRYFKEVPRVHSNFGFIDPAISKKDGSDWTAITIISVDVEGNWYVRVANRYKLNPTEIVDMAFRACKEWKIQTLGIEDVAYQEALLYMINDRSKAEGMVLPVHGIGKGDHRVKDHRILGLVPRFEWNRISLAQGLIDLENELNFFPRGSKDVIDSLARCEQIAYAPTRERDRDEPPSTNSKEYESWYIRNKLAQASGRNR